MATQYIPPTFLTQTVQLQGFVRGSVQVISGDQTLKTDDELLSRIDWEQAIK